MITNIAFATETANIAPHPTIRLSIKCELAIQNEIPVNAQSIIKTATNTPV